eukprot:TRINITY_DN6943_c0_g1_i2.p1 TRINITY_DN6943_c0_g1~~TRINITY_DN6943_c0_g1_i2.p1  ORF type:complete len:193 (+),score=15.12 TRINITY_DN6943_c0_g1_i2:481-1059(+)
MFDPFEAAKAYSKEMRMENSNNHGGGNYRGSGQGRGQNDRDRRQPYTTKISNTHTQEKPPEANDLNTQTTTTTTPIRHLLLPLHKGAGPLLSRLFKYLVKWVYIGALQMVLGWIRFGIHIPFSTTPTPHIIINTIIESRDKARYKDEEFQRFFKLGVIEQLPEADIDSAVVLPTHVVPKPHSDKMRLVINAI